MTTSVMKLSLEDYQHWLSVFQENTGAGPQYFVVESLSALNPPSSSAAPPGTLYVLDSSFNPPTRAHYDMAISALEHDRGAAPKRLILLLATRNADKAPQPASFEHRLALMAHFARDIHERLQSSSVAASMPIIDVALTSCPYFHDKAEMIATFGPYASSPSNAPIEQVHLVGFDTLLRIFDSKYYPPDHTLAPLGPFLAHHRLRVTYRMSTDPNKDDHGDGQEARSKQDAYVEDLRQGKRENEGGRREWADRIELVQGRVCRPRDGGNPDGQMIIPAVSSTRARQAAQAGDEQLLEDLVTDRVREYILREKLYAPIK